MSRPALSARKRPRVDNFQNHHNFVVNKEVIVMTASSNNNRNCCTMERKRLVEELRKCDYCTSSYEEFQQCYSETAKESGERSRSCPMA